MSHRIEKVKSTLMKAITEVISRGLSDPRAGGMISVTSLDVSPDMHNAIVHVSVYPAEKTKLTMHALEAASRHIRREVGDLVALRRVPDLTFRVDDSLKKQAEVFNALAKANAAAGKKVDEVAKDDGQEG